MRRLFRNVVANVAIYIVCAPVIAFYLVDRVGTALIALSSWAVARRPWSDRLFMTMDRIEEWQVSED
jgi:hypothetical protein